MTAQTLSSSDSAPSPDSQPTPQPKPNPISIAFVGDMMFDRHIRENADRRGGYEGILSPEVAAILQQANLAVGNLEGPVTSNSSLSVGSAVGSPRNYLFTFDPAVIPYLKTLNMHVVNLGNNHILNFGQDGLQETYQRLEAGGIAYFGATGEAGFKENETGEPRKNATESGRTITLHPRWITKKINETTI